MGKALISTSNLVVLTVSAKVALICNHLSPDVSHNLSQAARWVGEAGKKNVDLVCFGEYAFQGKEEDDYEKDMKIADTIPGVITSRLSRLAIKHSLYIVVGILEREQEALYDSAVLIDRAGDIVLRYRRINSQWHGRTASKDLYREGDEFGTATTPFGKVGIILCGDFFDDSVLAKVRKAESDILAVPVAIPIGLLESSYGDSASEKWATYKKEWICQAKRIGTTCVFVNSVSERKKGSHSGGAMIVSRDGQLLVEAEIGKESIVYHELS